jgi:Carboxypeptidase regulatory-like domain
VVSACADAAIVGSSGGGAGIQGKVLLGPMCPVQRADSPCPDRPIEADIKVTGSDGKTVANGHSGADGAFRISLKPGSYSVMADRPGSGFAVGKPVSVDVPVGTYVHVNLVVDSGIR